MLVRNLKTSRNATAASRRRSTMGNSAGLKVQDASTTGGIRIARRRIVTATLKQCLALDVNISCFDICSKVGLLASCTGKVLYLWSLEQFVVIHKFGRTSGSIHKGDITCCVFEESGLYLASCGEDRKVVIWNLKSKRAEKTFEASKAQVYGLKFSVDGALIFVSSADGRVTIRNWAADKVVSTFMRHESAPRTFQFSYKNPDRVICGLSDGAISVWDVKQMAQVDYVPCDPTWEGKKPEANTNDYAHHTGGILSCSIAPNNKLLLTTSTDFTAKLWNIQTYARDTDEVAMLEKLASESQTNMDGLINIALVDVEGEERCKESKEMMLGEVDIQNPYHADLRFTFRHEAPVLCGGWSNESDMCVTGSMDCTCRIWSARTGILLFQINMPAAVSHITVNSANELYCCCANRLLILHIMAHSKEEDVPDYWKEKRDEEYQKLEEEHARIRSGEEPYPRPATTETETERMTYAQRRASVQEKHKVKTAEEGERAPTKFTIDELRQLMAHGAVLPSFLDTLLDQHKSIDKVQLMANLKRHDIQPRELLRLVVSNQFRPEDLLTAMAAKNKADVLFNLIRQGASIVSYMKDAKYHPVEPQYAGRSSIMLDYRDFHAFDASRGGSPEHLRTPMETGPGAGAYGTHMSVGADGIGISGTGIHGDYYNPEEGDDSDLYDYEEEPVRLPSSSNDGNVVHFIPSEQLKLLKDIKAERPVKPVFLRKLIFGAENQDFPNFNSTEIRDNRPRVLHRAAAEEGIRFNELATIRNVMGRRGPQPKYNPRRRELQMRREMIAGMYPSAVTQLGAPSMGSHLAAQIRRIELLERKQGHERAAPGIRLGEENANGLSSSRTLFRPDRYVHVRGLNIDFGDMSFGRAAPPGGTLATGHIYAQPMMLRRHAKKDIQTQFLTGRGIPLQERVAAIFHN